jgi:hypothetical protein
MIFVELFSMFLTPPTLEELKESDLPTWSICYRAEQQNIAG